MKKDIEGLLLMEDKWMARIIHFQEVHVKDKKQ